MLICHLKYSAVVLLLLSFSGQVIFSENKNVLSKYKPEWSSLESRALPGWYDEAKFGIFIHWGIYSVPSFTSEWFWLDWKGIPLHNRELHDEIIQFMKTNFKPGFSYQDFARDFTAEFFNATEWAEIIGKSGAKYVVLTSKHHEGFALWPSKYSYSWNSVDTGPHIDIVGSLAKAVKKSGYGYKFGIYYSLYEWFNPLYLSDKSNNFTTQDFVDNKVFPEMLEIVNTYKPEVFWSDGEAEAPSEYWRSKEFIAWLYNDSPVRDSIVVNDRWGTGTICMHGGFFTCADRYIPGKLQQHKWENAMTIDKTTWGFNRRSNLEDYLSTQDLISTLVETVAFGGNLLLNVGPTKEGKISPIFEERLLNMGLWLNWNGEAIFKSTPWKVCQNDTKFTNVWYTRSSANDLFVIFLKWPKESVLYLSCPILSKKSILTMLGTNYKQLEWIVNDLSLVKVNLPPKSEIVTQWGWTIKIKNPSN